MKQGEDKKKKSLGEKISGFIKSDTFRQLVRYLITGVSAFIAEYLIYMFLFKVLKIDYAISMSIAFTIMFVVTFIVSRKWTFESTGNARRQFALYLLLFLFNLAFGNYVMMRLLVGAGVPESIAPFIKTAMITMWNFLLYKYVIYKE